MSERIYNAKCINCGKLRTTEPDYTPVQMIFGQTLGWYSGDDGELCPDCMTDLMKNQ